MKNYEAKVLTLILIIFLSLSVICFGQTKESDLDLISFMDIKDFYASGQPIEFYVQNNDKEPLFFYCPMEKSIDGQWREIILSIQEAKMTKSVKLLKILPNKKYKLIFNPKQKGFGVLKKLVDSGLFRFRLEVIKEAEKGSIAQIYSKEFIIR